MGHFTCLPTPTDRAKSRALGGQVIGPDVIRPAAIGAVGGGDPHVGQVHAGVELGDLRVIPPADLTHVDLGQQFAGELEVLLTPGTL